MSFVVRFSPGAEEDLIRLFDFLLDRATVLEDLQVADAAILAIQSAIQHHLTKTPYSFRKAGKSSTRRELIIPFGSSGYVALYEISSPTTVIVLAVRHQREEDYH
jgi:plasmid stabilization system protein ParE